MLVTIENATIDALAARAEVVEALPHIFQWFVTTRPTLCGTCGSNKVKLAGMYDKVKLSILSLSETDRAKLRGFLKADKVRLFILNGSNGVEHFI